MNIFNSTYKTMHKTSDIFIIALRDRKSTRLNSSHGYISYAVFCLKKKRSLEKFSCLSRNYYCVFTNSIEVDCWRKRRKFDLSLRSSRSSYFATVRHQLTSLSKTDALDEEKWRNMLGTFFFYKVRYAPQFAHVRDPLVLLF